MLQKLKNANAAVLGFMTRNIAKIVGLVIVSLAVVAIAVGHQGRTLNRPSNAKEFARTSVKITNLQQTSGGSGVILKSGPSESIILTNKHVCQLIQVGGVVTSLTGTVPIAAYKAYPGHDLCLVKVRVDLGVNTEVATKTPDLYTKTYVSGHPALLPPILTEGYFTQHMTIQVVVGMLPCTGEEKDEDALFCFMMGAKPKIETYDSQVVSATILPGSSGSGVFNAEGQISGLVFAGSQGLSYAFIVPFEYVQDFMRVEGTLPWSMPSEKNKGKMLFENYSKIKEICTEHKKELRKYCARRFPAIWIREF